MCSLDQTKVAADFLDIRASQREHLQHVNMQREATTGMAGQSNQGCTHSPLLVQIALDFYSNPGATDKYRLSNWSDDSAQVSCLKELEGAMLISRVGGEYVANRDPLHLFVRRLLRTPFPIHMWVMP